MTSGKVGELSLVDTSMQLIGQCYSPLQIVVRICLTYSIKWCTQGLTFWCPPGEFASTHLMPRGWTITLNDSFSNDKKPFTMAATNQYCTSSTGMLLIVKGNRVRPHFTSLTSSIQDGEGEGGESKSAVTPAFLRAQHGWITDPANCIFHPSESRLPAKYKIQ